MTLSTSNNTLCARTFLISIYLSLVGPDSQITTKGSLSLSNGLPNSWIVRKLTDSDSRVKWIFVNKQGSPGRRRPYLFSITAARLRQMNWLQAACSCSAPYRLLNSSTSTAFFRVSCRDSATCRTQSDPSAAGPAPPAGHSQTRQLPDIVRPVSCRDSATCRTQSDPSAAGHSQTRHLPDTVRPVSCRTQSDPSAAGTAPPAGHSQTCQLPHTVRPVSCRDSATRRTQSDPSAAGHSQTCQLPGQRHLPDTVRPVS